MSTMESGKPDFHPSTRLADFEEQFRIPDDKLPKMKTSTALRNFINSFNLKRMLLRTFPIVPSLVSYRPREYLPNDIIAGLISGFMIIPQGMANAALSSLPHYVGLYISFFGAFTYMIFGSNMHVSVGCVAIISLMMGTILNKYDKSQAAQTFIDDLQRTYNNSTQTEIQTIIDNTVTARRIQLAAGLSFISGLVFILASRIGLDKISYLFSNSLTLGFTIGIAFNVGTSQLVHVFGLTIKSYHGTFSLFKTWIAVLGNIEETNYVAFLLFLASAVSIFVVKMFNQKYQLRVPIPIELLVVIAAILVSKYLKLNKEYQVSIVGYVPKGVPGPRLPDISLISVYIPDALIVTIVAYAQSLSIAKTLEQESGERLDSKQEMLAAGLCCSFSGLFSGYMPCGSVSRSVVQRNSGGKTQIASLIAALLVLLIITVLGPEFQDLPDCVMSAIILVALISLFRKLLIIPNEWRKSTWDCAVMIFSCLVTIIFDTGLALLLCVVFSLLLVLLRSLINPVTEIGQIRLHNSQTALRSVEKYMSTTTDKTVKIIKMNTSLYHLNCEIFQEEVFKVTKVNPVQIIQSRKDNLRYKNKNSETIPILKKLSDPEIFDLKTLVIDICEIPFVDLMGIDTLDTIINQYQCIGVNVLVAAVPENIFNILSSTEFLTIHRDNIFLTIEDALESVKQIQRNGHPGTSNTTL